MSGEATSGESIVSGNLQTSLLTNKSKKKKSLRVTYNDNASIDTSHTLSKHPTTADPLKNYDFCMVFHRQVSTKNPMIPGNSDDHDEISEIGKVFLDHLTLVGINWILVSSLNKKYVYLLLKAKLNVIHQLAMDLEYQLLLDPKILQQLAETGDVESGILPIKIQHVPAESPLLPYEHIYAPFRKDSKVDPSVYWRPFNGDHPFRELVRMKLTELLIETQLLVPTIISPNLHSPPTDSSPQTISNSDGTVSIRNSILNGHIVAFFPLHHQQTRDHLAKIWMQPFLLPWRYPMDEIREYFGEKIALYFEFMGHYTFWLLIPALIGIPVQIICWSENNYNTPEQVGFSCLLMIWAVCMLEYWKRTEKTIALKRGMLEYEDTEADRPEFDGVPQPSHLDGKVKIYFPRHERRRRLLIASLITFGCIGVVIGAVVSIYIIRAALSGPVGGSAQIISSIINAIQIQFFKYWYISLADTMTEWENPRTDTEFEDAMIPKLYMFEFVNSYASFFYVAFIAPSLNDCASETCMAELGVNLFIIFAIRVASGMLSEGLYPFYLLQLRNKKLATVLEETQYDEIPLIDLQFNLASYDIVKDSLSEYSEIAIQYGYIVLFASALPIASLVGLVCCILETKIDAYKFLYLYKKPSLRGAQDIGNWQLIFTITTIAAVTTNAALVVFTMNYLDDHSIQFRFWFFCIFQWVIFGFLVILMEAIPDIPNEIAIQLHRQRILVEKVIFRLKDVEENDLKTTDSSYPPGTPGLASPSLGTHFHIHDYRSFLHQQKRGPFSPRKQFSSPFLSNRLLDIFAEDIDGEEKEDCAASSGGTTPNHSPHSPMPAVYTLPSPARKMKYSYSRSSTFSALPRSLVIDEEEGEDQEGS